MVYNDTLFKRLIKRKTCEMATGYATPLSPFPPSHFGGEDRPKQGTGEKKERRRRQTERERETQPKRGRNQKQMGSVNDWI